MLNHNKHGDSSYSTFTTSMRVNKRLLIIAILVLALLIVGYLKAPSASFRQSTGASAPMTMSDASYDMAYGEGVAQESRLGLSKAMGSPIMPPSPQPPGYQTGGGEEFMPDQRLIIKTANMSVVVDDVRAAVQAVVDFAVSKGGFEVNRSVQKEGVGYGGSVTVRLASASFDQGLEAVRGLGEVRSQNVNGQDVTEEFVDVQAQLHNLRATEQQFLEIMKRATEIEDILAVQRELSNVRSQIEQLEGRKKYLEQSASLSTLTVYFSTNPETLPVVDEQDRWKPLGVAKEALRNLLDLAKGIVNFIIWVVVYLPVWIVLGVLVYIAHRWYKKHHVLK